FRQSQLQKILIEHTDVVWPPVPGDSGAGKPVMEATAAPVSDEAPPPHVAQAASEDDDEDTVPGVLDAPRAHTPSTLRPSPGPALAMAPAALSLTQLRGQDPDTMPARPAEPPASDAGTAVEVPEGPSVLDPEALRRLHDLDPKGTNQLMERVARAFDTSLSRMLPQLEEAVKLQDQAAVMHVAHTLKSSSASIGALKLSHMCAEIEAMIRRQSGEDLTSRILEIPMEAERVTTALRRLLEPKA
ncbi:MAG: hypothetical protein RI920_2415, partial [Pseudomonadota bacterium]